MDCNRANNSHKNKTKFLFIQNLIYIYNLGGLRGLGCRILESKIYFCDLNPVAHPNHRWNLNYFYNLILSDNLKVRL